MELEGEQRQVEEMNAEVSRATGVARRLQEEIEEWRRKVEESEEKVTSKDVEALALKAQVAEAKQVLRGQPLSPTSALLLKFISDVMPGPDLKRGGNRRSNAMRKTFFRP